MADVKFVRADIGKLESFVSESEEAIHEFGEIKNEFRRINETLLKQWEGSGRAAYKQVSDHITEKISDIETILTTINDNVLKDIIAEYKKVDKELGDYNRHAGEQQGGAAAKGVASIATAAADATINAVNSVIKPS